MACWMLACFSLTTYTKSLLTASLMARPVWEADDSLDEMLPKLRRGLLLPCAENNSFMDVLLARADGSGGDAMGIMALAVRRWGHKKARISGSYEDCLERTRRGNTRISHRQFHDLQASALRENSCSRREARS
ncbi:hypothetical protein MTO96_004599 [Rhipicephalus appendiculatus]